MRKNNVAKNIPLSNDDPNDISPLVCQLPNCDAHTGSLLLTPRGGNNI